MKEQKDTSILGRFGYKQELARVLGIFSVLAITLSAISPTTSVFLTYGVGLSQAGTGVVLAFIVGGIVAMAMALNFAELGSAFPIAGGSYSIVLRVLGKPVGFLAALIFLILGLVIDASILVAGATYLHILIPSLPANLMAVGFMMIITILSLLRIGTASWATAYMFIVEFAVILVFAVASFIKPVQPASLIFVPKLFDAGGASVSVSIAAIAMAVVPALFAFNGYDWPLYFSEEAINARKSVARGIVISAATAVIVETLSVAAALLATPSFSEAAAASMPLSYVAEKVLGHTGAVVVLVGVVIAMFDCALAGNLGYMRIFYTSGRDGMWPPAVNRFFSRVHSRTQIPYLTAIFLGVGVSVFAYFSSLTALITFTGVLIVLLYLLIALSALVSRITQPKLERPFRMILWPLPPIIALLGGAFALAQQSKTDLLISAGLLIFGLLYYIVYLRRRLANVSFLSTDLATGGGGARDDNSRGSMSV